MDNFAPRACLQCGKTLSGRTDKKFCDAYCRNSYNNQNRPDEERRIQLTNSALRKNRTILKTLCPEGKATVRREVLETMGFDFSYFTALYHSSQTTYFLVYDFGFAAIWERDIPKVLIIHKQDYMDRQPFDPWRTLMP